MFTGIIEELGQVQSIKQLGRNSLLEVRAGKVAVDAKIGDSIAVNGVCLTVIKNFNNILSFEVMPQTFRVTNLGAISRNDKLNLERSLKIGDRVSGHFVYGHVDFQGVIRKKTQVRDNLSFEIAVPTKFLSYINLHGSIAVDGISLTVQEKKSNTFSVYIIPHTLKNTTLCFKRPSDKVNIEIDKLGRG